MHGAIPPLPQYAFMAWCLVKHRDNFTFHPPYLFAVPSIRNQSTGLAVVTGTHITRDVFMY